MWNIWVTAYLQSPIMLFSFFDLKWGRIWLYPKYGTEQQHMEEGLVRPMWLLEHGFELDGTSTAVFSFKSNTLCCTHCNNNNTLKQEVTLIHTEAHWSSHFSWGQEWTETTFPAFAFPSNGASGGAGNGLLEFSGKLIVHINPEKEFPFLFGLLGMQWTIQFALDEYHLHFIFVLFTDFPPSRVSLCCCIVHLCQQPEICCWCYASCWAWKKWKSV